MNTRRVLIVDDSCLYQRLLTDMFNQQAGCEVVGVAASGSQALTLISELKPELITLDPVVPELDCKHTRTQLQTQLRTQLIDEKANSRLLMISSPDTHQVKEALEVLMLDTGDFIAKPDPAESEDAIEAALAAQLLPWIRQWVGANASLKVLMASVSESVARRSGLRAGFAGRQRPIPQMLAIGISTGGPDALAVLLAGLPGDLEIPVVIVQHMPSGFTGKLARRLNACSALSVREAEAGDTVSPGTVYIAPGDYHMALEQKGGKTLIQLNQKAMENSCRPSVDPLFRSAAAIYKDRTLGVIMTGMGQDGLLGAESVFSAGGLILAQDEETCVVWGMPKLVTQTGLAEDQVPLHQMADCIMARVRPKNRAWNTARPDLQANAGNANACVVESFGGMKS